MRDPDEPLFRRHGSRYVLNHRNPAGLALIVLILLGVGVWLLFERRASLERHPPVPDPGPTPTWSVPENLVPPLPGESEPPSGQAPSPGSPDDTADDGGALRDTSDRSERHHP